MHLIDAEEIRKIALPSLPPFQEVRYATLIEIVSLEYVDVLEEIFGTKRISWHDINQYNKKICAFKLFYKGQNIQTVADTLGLSNRTSKRYRIEYDAFINSIQIKMANVPCLPTSKVP